ncbi:MAG: archaeosortase C [Candidatus Hodarchaeales archaeon]|jgi:archaeosortase C (PEF-CTERM variant)
MEKKYFNVVLILVVLSFFLGATVQFSEGSSLVGFSLFILGIILLSRIKIEASSKIKPGHSNIFALAGILIITFDIFYNSIGLGKGGINTLDTMVLLLGASLIGRSSPKGEIRKLGTFGTAMSLSFIILFLTFYVALNNQLYKFDHYFVMLPSAYLVKALGFPIEIVETETLRIGGVDDLVVKIGGPCSGLYSMFLLVGIVMGYSVTEGIDSLKKIAGLTLIAASIAYFGNFVRVSIIYIIGYLYGSEIMMSFHVHLGWILFAGTSITILFLMEKARVMGR